MDNYYTNTIPLELHRALIEFGFPETKPIVLNGVASNITATYAYTFDFLFNHNVYVYVRNVFSGFFQSCIYTLENNQLYYTDEYFLWFNAANDAIKKAIEILKEEQN